MSLKKIKRKLVYRITLIFIAFFRSISLKRARKIATYVGRLLLLFSKKEKHILYANIANTSFDIFPPILIKRLVQNMMYTFAEFIKMAYMDIEDIRSMFTVKGEDVLKTALERGKGVLLMTGHIGNWELLGTYLGKSGYKVNAIYRKPSNDDYDSLIRRFRALNKVKLIENSDSWNGSIDALKKNEILIVLADQNPKNDSPKIPFLGKEASTPKGPALFAIKSKATVICSFVIRTKKGFKIEFKELEYADKKSLKDKIISILTALNDVYSDIIRKYPYQWVWFHDRWGLFS